MKKEIPILFSTPMVKAILAGKKTMTRRIINPQPIIDEDSGSVFDGKYNKQYDIHNWKDEFIDDWSRWMPGDLLWVRETFCPWGGVNSGYAYKADGFIQRYGAWERDTPKKFHDIERIEKWTPSIYMPKEAARIWLEVTDLKVERLQDITEEDAIAEGATQSFPMPEKNTPWTAITQFEIIWDRVNGEESWPSNPFVWVISFKVLSTTGKNIVSGNGKMTLPTWTNEYKFLHESYMNKDNVK